MDSVNGWRIRFVPLSKPQLLTAQDAKRPEIPSLPTQELVLATGANFKAYVGEEYHGLLVSSHSVFNSAAIASEAASSPSKLDDSNKLPERVHLSAQIESEKSGVQSIPVTTHHPTADQPFASSSFTFTPKYPGKLKIRAMLQLDLALESVRASNVTEIDVDVAISIRFKVSRGSTSLNAYVLEAQVENLTDTTITLEECELVPKNNWIYEKVSSALDESVILRPNEVYQYSFMLRNGDSSEAAALSVSWRREPVGSKGYQTTATVKI